MPPKRNGPRVCCMCGSIEALYTHFPQRLIAEAVKVLLPVPVPGQLYCNNCLSAKTDNICGSMNFSCKSKPNDLRAIPANHEECRYLGLMSFASKICLACRQMLRQHHSITDSQSPTHTDTDVCTPQGRLSCSPVPSWDGESGLAPRSIFSIPSPASESLAPRSLFPTPSPAPESLAEPTAPPPIHPLVVFFADTLRESTRNEASHSFRQVMLRFVETCSSVGAAVHSVVGIFLPGIKHRLASFFVLPFRSPAILDVLLV